MNDICQQDPPRLNSENSGMATMIDSYLDNHTVALLIEYYGGRRLVVPAGKQGKAWKRLVIQIGEDRAASVIRWFGGEVLAIPMAVDEKTAETIRNLRQAGTPVAEIAKLGFVRRYSERQIYRICEPKAA